MSGLTHLRKHIKRRGFKEKEFIKKEDNTEEYAEVIGAEGETRFKCQLLNGEQTIVKLKGSLKKGPHKQYVKKGDAVLVQKVLSADPAEEKYQIINRFTPDEKKKLIKSGEWKEFKINTNAVITETTVIMDTEVSNITHEKELTLDEIMDL